MIVCLCVPKPCPTHYFFLYDWIKKVFSKNDYDDKTVCRLQKMLPSKRARPQSACKLCAKAIVYIFMSANNFFLYSVLSKLFYINTVELQWLEHLWNHENMFETGVVRASEC